MCGKNDDTTPGRRKKRFEGVGAEIRVHRHRIGAVSLECLACVQFRRVADVAALGVEDERNLGIRDLDVITDALQLGLRAERREISDLWLECADVRRGCIDYRDAEVSDCIDTTGHRAG